MTTKRTFVPLTIAVALMIVGWVTPAIADVDVSIQVQGQTQNAVPDQPGSGQHHLPFTGAEPGLFLAFGIGLIATGIFINKTAKVAAGRKEDVFD